MKIIVLGASGMLGFGVFKTLVKRTDLDVYGTVRNKKKFKKYFSQKEYKRLIEFDFYSHTNQISEIIQDISPDHVINCIGLITQEKENNKSHSSYISLNSLFPHKVAESCDKSGARLIHFSTDCVFSGQEGNYSESDTPDAYDIYGRSKLLGEINYSNHITLRISLIGHELASKKSLVDWFFTQNQVVGYDRVIFSGLPVNHIADSLYDFVFPNDKLKGIYHLSSDPISKYELLVKLSSVYESKIKINKGTDLISDKSLNSDLFRKITGYSPPSWDNLIISMHKYYIENFHK